MGTISARPHITGHSCGHRTETHMAREGTGPQWKVGGGQTETADAHHCDPAENSPELTARVLAFNVMLT